MPIYEYQCQKCQHEFEVMQKMSDDAITDCPECHKGKVSKLISESGFQLKGSGWYVTDYKNKKPTDKASSTTTDKPEKKAETKKKADSSKDS